MREGRKFQSTKPLERRVLKRQVKINEKGKTQAWEFNKCQFESYLVTSGKQAVITVFGTVSA